MDPVVLVKEQVYLFYESNFRHGTRNIDFFLTDHPWFRSRPPLPAKSETLTILYTEILPDIFYWPVTFLVSSFIKIPKNLGYKNSWRLRVSTSIVGFWGRISGTEPKTLGSSPIKIFYFSHTNFNKNSTTTKF